MHSCVYVLITGPEEQTEGLVAQAMAPFDEAIHVAPYKMHLSSGGVRAMAEHYGVPATDLPALVGKMPDWMDSPAGIDELGLFAIRTDNPNGKWDWYEIGGRWDGYLVGRSRSRRPRRQHELANNSLPAAKLLAAGDFAQRLPDTVLTPLGDWVERLRFITTDAGWYTWQTPELAWLAYVRRILTAFPDHRVVCVDAHC